MINLPNGETWTNGETNSDLAIAWVKSMFVDAADNTIPIGDHEARGEAINRDFHCCIITVGLSPNLRIKTEDYYKLTTAYEIEEI